MSGAVARWLLCVMSKAEKRDKAAEPTTDRTLCILRLIETACMLRLIEAACILRLTEAACILRLRVPAY